MGELDDIRSHIAALSAEVDHLRDELALTRELTAMEGRGAAENRSAQGTHTQMLHEQQQTLTTIIRSLESLAGTVGGLVVGQAEILQHLDALADVTGALSADHLTTHAEPCPPSGP